VFDHCAIVLKNLSEIGVRNHLGVWQSDNRFKEFIRTKWSSYEVLRGGLFVFKEKFKKLKADLKVWNKEVFGNILKVGVELQKRISELDERDEEDELDELGREEMRILLAEQNGNSFKHEAIMHQKARLKWMKQGYLNTKKFHSIEKWRWFGNNLHGLVENGQWCADKDVVKDKVREFFLFYVCQG